MSDIQSYMHIPVLFKETIAYLNPQPGEFAIDGTINGGGHASAILERILPTGTLLGVDWDQSILDATRRRLAHESQVVLVHDNYARLREILDEQELDRADMVFLDLGFSSLQLSASGRGFSFANNDEEPLLMTYDPESATTARDLLRELSEKELADTIYELSGERYSRRIAKAIKEHLRSHAIETVGDLRAVIKNVLPRGYERGRIDPATRTFQALRIRVNHELENLRTVLADLPFILKPGGRVVILTFHSLEDRVVKEEFRRMHKEGILDILTKKPIPASEEEIRDNPRSRSAKLRCARMRSLTIS